MRSGEGQARASAVHDDRNEERAGQQSDLEAPDLVEHQLAARHRRREEELQLRVGERERRIGAADQPPFRDEEREPEGGERRHRGERPRISRPWQDGANAARLAAGAIDEEDEVQDRDGDRDQIAR